MKNNDTIIGGTPDLTINPSGSTDYVYISDDNMSSINLGDLTCDTITLTGLDNYISTPCPSVGNITIGSNSNNSGINWNSSTITFTDPNQEIMDRLERLEAIIAEEKEIRDNCPAVKNAYDEYRFLLVLAKKNKGDLLTDN